MRATKIHTGQCRCPMVDAKDERDPWYAEAQGMTDHMEDCDFAVAEAAELPYELAHHATSAEEDDDFNDQFEEWWNYLFEGDDRCLLLAIGQVSLGASGADSGLSASAVCSRQAERRRPRPANAPTVAFPRLDSGNRLTSYVTSARPIEKKPS